MKPAQEPEPDQPKVQKSQNAHESYIKSNGKVIFCIKPWSDGIMFLIISSSYS